MGGNPHERFRSSDSFAFSHRFDFQAFLLDTESYFPGHEPFSAPASIIYSAKLSCKFGTCLGRARIVMAASGVVMAASGVVMAASGVVIAACGVVMGASKVVMAACGVVTAASGVVVGLG